MKYFRIIWQAEQLERKAKLAEGEGRNADAALLWRKASALWGESARLTFDYGVLPTLVLIALTVVVLVVVAVL